MIVLLFWICVFTYLLIFKGTNSLLYTPVLTVCQIISWQFQSINQIENREIIISNYLFMFFLILLSIIKLYKSKIVFSTLHKLIIIWIILLLFQSFLNTTEEWESFKKSLHIITSLFVFLGIISFDFSDKNFLTAIKQTIYFLIIFSGNIIFLTIFSIGEPFKEKLLSQGTYAATFLRGGWFTIYSMHGVAIITSLIPFILKLLPSRWKRIYFWVIFIVSILILALTFKRSYFLILFTGIFFYILFSINKINKNLILKFILIIYLFVFLASSLYLFKSYISKREKILNATELTSEGRYMEFMYYPEVINKEGLMFMLVGKELFVSSGKFVTLDQIEKGRFLHNDYSNLLYGVGIIGLLLYISIFYKIYTFSKKYYFKNPSLPNKHFYYIIITTIFTILISGTGDGILNITNRVVPFYFIGVMFSLLRDNKIVILKKLKLFIDGI